MLSFFRKVRSSWLVVGLLGLIMLAFVITGVGTRGTGGIGQMGQGPERVATIGDEPVTVPEVNERLNRELDQARRERPELDMARFVRSGAFDAIITQLINTKVLTVFGAKNGLAASKRMIDGQIATIPGFQNAAGKFDDTQFRAALANAKVTEAQLRDDIRTQLIQRQLLLPVAAAPKVPDAVARQYAALLLEQRSGSVAIVPVDTLGPGPEPTDAEIAAYFQQHQDRYAIPERRVLRYAVFGAPQVAAQAKATDAEIAAYYKDHAADYAAKEARALSQVVLPDEAAARAFAAKIAGGKSFTQAAAEAGYGAADISIGTRTKADVVRLSSPPVADAAFAAPRGGVTAPVRSPLGWHILRVDGVDVTPGRPLEAVRGEIVAQIEQRKGEDAMAALATKIEESIADGASFEETVRANGLQVQETAPVTATGAAPGVPGYQFPAEANALLKGAFDLSPDDEPVVETIVNGQRYALLTLGRIVAAAPPPLAQIRGRVHDELIRERALNRTKALAQQLADKVNRGIALSDAVAQAGTRLPPVQSVSARRMDLAQQGRQVPPPLQMIFSLPRGKARILPGPNGSGWYVVQLDAIVPGNIDNAPGLIEATRSQLSQVVGEEYAEQFARAATREVEVSRHNDTIARLKKQLETNAAAE